VTIEVSHQRATSFETTIPEGLLPGKKDISILSSQGNLTYQSAIEILEQEPKTTEQEPGAIEAPALRQKVNDGPVKQLKPNPPALSADGFGYSVARTAFPS